MQAVEEEEGDVGRDESAYYLELINDGFHWWMKHSDWYASRICVVHLYQNYVKNPLNATKLLNYYQNVLSRVWQIREILDTMRTAATMMVGLIIYCLAYGGTWLMVIHWKNYTQYYMML